MGWFEENDSRSDELRDFTEQVNERLRRALTNAQGFRMLLVEVKTTDLGTMTADLYAPKVFIPPENPSKTFLQLRFKEGWMKSISKQNNSINYWTWTVECPVGPEEDQWAQEHSKLASMDEAERNFDLAKFYTAERLTSRLSNAKWGTPVKKYSAFGENKETDASMTYSEWVAKHPHIRGWVVSIIERGLSEWAKTQIASGRFTLPP